MSNIDIMYEFTRGQTTFEVPDLDAGDVILWTYYTRWSGTLADNPIVTPFSSPSSVLSIAQNGQSVNWSVAATGPTFRDWADGPQHEYPKYIYSLSEALTSDGTRTYYYSSYQNFENMLLICYPLTGIQRGSYTLTFNLPAGRIKSEIAWGKILRGVDFDNMGYAEQSYKGNMGFSGDEYEEKPYYLYKQDVLGSTEPYERNDYPFTLPFSAPSAYVVCSPNAQNIMNLPGSYTNRVHIMDSYDDNTTFCDIGVITQAYTLNNPGTGSMVNCWNGTFEDPQYDLANAVAWLILYQDPDYRGYEPMPEPPTAGGAKDPRAGDDDSRSKVKIRHDPPVVIVIKTPTDKVNAPVDTNEHPNRMMLVCVTAAKGRNQDLAQGQVIGDEVASMTYNGINLTRIGREIDPTGQQFVEMWRLVAPQTGTHEIVINFDGVVSAGVIGVINYYNVNQADPTEGWLHTSGAGSVHQLDYTISSKEYVIVDSLSADSSLSASPTSTGTGVSEPLFYEVTQVPCANMLGAGREYLDCTSGYIKWTSAGGRIYAYGATALHPSTVPGTPEDEFGDDPDDDPQGPPREPPIIPPVTDGDDPNTGSEATNTPGCVVQGNTFLSCTDKAIHGMVYNRILIDGNVFGAGGTGPAIYLDNVDNSRVSNNLITGYQGSGMIIGASWYTTICDNEIHDACLDGADGRYGIELVRCYFGQVAGNRISNSTVVPTYAMRLSPSCVRMAVVDNDLRYGFSVGPIADESFEAYVERNLPEQEFDARVQDVMRWTLADSDTVSFDYDTYSGQITANVAGATSGAAFAEAVQDQIGASLVAGSNVTITYDDDTGETTIASSGGPQNKIFDFHPEFTNAIIVPALLENGTLMPYDDAVAGINAYEWTADAATDQTVQIVVRWRIPLEFTAMEGSLKVWCKSTLYANASMQLLEFLDTAGVNAIYPHIRGEQTWKEENYWLDSGATWTPGGTCTLRFKLTAKNGGKVYLGPVRIPYTEG